MMCESALGDDVCKIIKSITGSLLNATSSCTVRLKAQYRQSNQWKGPRMLPQRFSVQRAVVQFEVSLPLPPEEASWRASGPDWPHWLPPPASDWHHSTARDIKQDNNSCLFLLLLTTLAHIVQNHIKLNDNWQIKGQYLSRRLCWNLIYEANIFSRSLSWQIIKCLIYFVTDL